MSLKYVHMLIKYYKVVLTAALLTTVILEEPEYKCKCTIEQPAIDCIAVEMNELFVYGQTIPLMYIEQGKTDITAHAT